jgi:putative flavoprotein involved in K+ transport
MRDVERVEAVVIGGGQAGLSVGYHLARREVRFVVLDAHPRIGDSWRARWDSLRLFTPAFLDGLAGMPFPAPAGTFPTKDEMADYLEAYARRFELPVRTGVRVDGLARQDGAYVVSAGERRFEAAHVVVAMADFQRPRVPPCARDLHRDVVQLHSSEYRNPSQLREGSVLVVGAGNSGAEIALEVARAGHPTWISGRSVGQIPFRIDGLAARLILARLVLRGVFHHVLTVRTPLGRKARPKVLAHGGPLIRVKAADLAGAGVEPVPRVVAARDGRAVLEDGRALAASNVIWCTGFEPGFSWIRLPVFAADGRPSQERGIVPSEPGLYFVGLHFLYALSSVMIHGVGRDAARIADTIADRLRAPGRVEERRPGPQGASPSASAAHAAGAPLDGPGERGRLTPPRTTRSPGPPSTHPSEPGGSSPR